MRDVESAPKAGRGFLLAFLAAFLGMLGGIYVLALQAGEARDAARAAAVRAASDTPAPSVHTSSRAAP